MPTLAEADWVALEKQFGGVFGVDVSAYQPNFDFMAACNEGYYWAAIKATEGSGWKSAYYAAQIVRARNAGQAVVAYHYQSTQSVAAQIANVVSMVSTDTPVAIDVELGSGGVDITRALVDGLRAKGYRVPFIYLPKWYWQGHLGSPGLAGLPPNWVSWYPDNVARFGSAGLSLVPESVWAGFGGLPVIAVQFTSSGRVANYPGGNIDLDFYRGTRAMFLALIGAATSGSGTDEEAELSELSDKINAMHTKIVGDFSLTLDERPKPIDQPDDLRGDVMSLRVAVANIAESLAKLAEETNTVEIDYTKLAAALKAAGVTGGVGGGVTREQLIADVGALLQRQQTTTTLKQSL